MKRMKNLFLVAALLVVSATAQAATNAAEVATEMETAINSHIATVLPIVASVIVALFAFPLIRFTWRKIKSFLR